MKKKDICLAILFIFILLVGVNFIIPVITGSTQLFIVLSGSMDPVMRPGDIVVVESISPDELDLGDVIAYRDPDGQPDVLITHRIISVEGGDEYLFQTKGDANEEMDDYKVPGSNLVGKMVFVIPFAGYLPETSKNSNLFFFIVILPAFLLVADEIKNMF